MHSFSIATIRDLAEYEEIHHVSTRCHEQCVAEMVCLLSQQLNLDNLTVRQFSEAGRYHDIGKTSIDRCILNKPSKLEPDEWAAVRKHCEIGAMMISKMWEGHDIAHLGALSHHENYDGTGYPFGLRGDNIPLVGRVIAVCDVYHALREHRAYRPAFDHDHTMLIMNHERHKFDPRIFENFKLLNANHLDEIVSRQN